MTLKINSGNTSEFLTSINEVIISLLCYKPTVERVAQALGCSVRTLQRRLEEADEDFSTLLLKIRRHQACWLLEHSEKRISDIAKALGYASPSTFSRAFLHWQGISPNDYRKQTISKYQSNSSI